MAHGELSDIADYLKSQKHKLALQSILTAAKFITFFVLVNRYRLLEIIVVRQKSIKNHSPKRNAHAFVRNQEILL